MAINKNFFLLFFLFLVACTPTDTDLIKEPMSKEWLEYEHTDVLTGETFRIGDLEKPVFIETFATWCASCKRQQIEFRYFKTLQEVNVVAVSIDPTDDEDAIRTYANDNNFDWHYSIASPEFTDLLIGSFGQSIVNAPLVPVILLCEESVTRLPRGVKDEIDLENALLAC